ncbi:uncharacterized protein LOC121998008 [Zingiber officinale]|uniref:Glabrous enhancer-binding protein-like DBD domain-containing protein n=1 Tax=Zingiber officinale TaxID=94328 RepID=A0A8J5L5A1_ZINOF|nr:uncharacterized protein LOC121998008 [Zingiber officinale]KAG6501506.1 hypothetical protein ZIOFF_041387 [Zingiber officinale]
MATSTTTSIHLDPSTAAPPRKLPIKRKKAPLPFLDTLAKPSSSSDPLDPSFDDDEENGFDEAEEANAVSVDARPAPGIAAAQPFRFQRVWSESDEIRFLQGLLGCWSQGLVFPRDLNIFFDRFSESMQQPFTRSQLSEKLRRLRKKFRIMSARIARGQDPARVAPHDRDVFHLCTRLWHPSYAASSPYSATDALAPGSGGNKRRRPNYRIPSGQAHPESLFAVASLPPPMPISTFTPSETLPLPPPTPASAHGNVAYATDGVAMNTSFYPVVAEDKAIKEEAEVEPSPGSCSNEASVVKVATSPSLAKIFFDVFDACLQEWKVSFAGSYSSSTSEKSNLEKRWSELRLAEMNVLSRRLRLVLEKSIKN